MARTIIETATDLLSLSRFVFEIRAPFEALSDEETKAFNGIIADAVDAVRTDANLPVLPQRARVILEIRNNDGVLNYEDDPFCLAFDGLTSRTTAVFFASARSDLRSFVFTEPLPITILNEPISDEGIEGRLTAKAAMALNNYYQVSYRRGIFADSNVVGDLRSLAILRARAIFDGTVSVPDRSRSAYERILERVRYEGILPQSFETVG